MLKRVFALCAFGLALPMALLQAQDLFVLPGAGATNGVGEAFVTNLTNEVYPIAQDTQGTDAEIFNAPRQWGIRVSWKF